MAMPSCVLVPGRDSQPGRPTFTLMTEIAEKRSIRNRLVRRLQIEDTAKRTGISFRRHPNREFFEGIFVKPLLRAALFPTGLYALGKRNVLRTTVRELRLEFSDLPSAFDGFRILHLSDLHVDALSELGASIAKAIENVAADICVMTGDYRFATHGSCLKPYRGMRLVLDAIHCPVYAILGNHDPAEMGVALEEMGATMLINEALPLQRGDSAIWLAGAEDTFDYRCHDMPATFCEVPGNTFTILLAHTPDLYAEAAARNVRLYLCGHTHGGQIRIPGIGAVMSNSDAPKEYTYGLWRHAGMHGYTSGGAGCSMLPIRFNCPAEVTVFELRRA